jgi:hypothetical protein
MSVSFDSWWLHDTPATAYGALTCSKQCQYLHDGSSCLHVRHHAVSLLALQPHACGGWLHTGEVALLLDDQRQTVPAKDQSTCRVFTGRLLHDSHT